MALIFMDGCDTQTYNYQYYNGNYNISSGSFFGTSYMSSAYVYYRRSLLATNDTSFYYGSWVRCGINALIFRVYKAGAINYSQGWGEGCGVATNNQGLLYITRWNTDTRSGVVASTANTITGDSQWHWIEVKADFSGGSSQIYMDGNLILNYSGSMVTSGTASCDELLISDGSDFDDIVWYSDQNGGITGSLFPLGPQRIVTIRPSSDDSVQFTRDAGLTNFSRVNEQTLNTADYVYANTSGLTDLYTMGDLTYTPSTVRALAIKTIAQNGGDGTIGMNHVVKDGSNTYTSGSFGMLYTPAMYNTYLETNQASGGANWNPTVINDIKIGYKVT